MVEDKRLICQSKDLVDGGDGFRFTVPGRKKPIPAFLIRYRGKVHGYLNQCAHVNIELDWNNGNFFDFSKLYLVCSFHGAIYLPESGICAGGPCRGGRLSKLLVEEMDGNIYLLSSGAGNG